MDEGLSASVMTRLPALSAANESVDNNNRELTMIREVLGRICGALEIKLAKSSKVALPKDH
jgi:hypothetical protein